MVTVDNISKAKQILKERIYDSLDEIAKGDITNREQGDVSDITIKPEINKATSQIENK